ncbi:MAG: hypothetical protein U1E40_07820 [Amaricoccus sp.]
MTDDRGAATPPDRVVGRVLAVLAEASTTPGLVEVGDGSRWVLKFSGAGPGPYGLLVEFLALRIAAAMGAPVPAAEPLWLPPGFPWQAGTDEFDAMLQRSWGWNLGIAFVPDARPIAAAELAGFDPGALDAIARSDALLQNMDRTARNPNLIVAGGRLHAVDYDACLYLSRALGPPRAPSRALPAGHLLAGRAVPPAPMPAFDLAGMLAAAPDAWLAAAGRDRSEVAAALGSYIADYQ